MMKPKQRALVVCPGRGTYNKTELGYLQRYHRQQQSWLSQADNYRAKQQQVTLTELDSAAEYSLKQHSAGDNASSLIYACAYCDFLTIDQDQFEIVAVTGNSMGWYISLAVAAAMESISALTLINTMGNLMHQSLIGGQVIYPLVDANWQPIEGRRAHLLEMMAAINQQTDCELTISIELGGMLVFGGNELALKQLTEALPLEQGRFPMRLFNHAAFHTPLQQVISLQAKQLLTQDLFQQPHLPLVDGRGKLWSPYSTDLALLWNYTLGCQVTETYDFTKAIQVGVKEFAPDKVIILGPGTTLGGAVAQSLIAINWLGWQAKEDFIERQKTDPFIISMGLEEQRSLIAPQ
ncbi:ACP S-malonyltransferase [Endozoicomonas sp. SM1973]|uniref:[acyl-carrier-protein] S-malonyltransferase n=1 Tax=Spartinivicinus marinus TaxID=2994442 RepID=A0A853IDN6_9GAMM|nr:ACP S-malonyltransferase [Spartinivicinus marinus]MCX4028871.1 ACP S-malonyltransferase [Spartinivicinus marinus]NYZ65546.1 ACP S-malonyltransferase [Spartinivicinus marinus]